MEAAVQITCLEYFGEKPSRWYGQTADGRDVYIRYRRGRLQVFVGELPPPIHEGELDPGCRVRPFYETRIGDAEDSEISAGSLVEYMGDVAKLPEWVPALARKEEALREHMNEPLHRLELKPRALRIVAAYLHEQLGKGIDDLTVTDAARLKSADLLKMRGFGDRSINDLYDALVRRGLELDYENSILASWGTHLWWHRTGALDGIVTYAGDYLDVEA
jgi:hypothetical protein